LDVDVRLYESDTVAYTFLLVSDACKLYNSKKLKDLRDNIKMSTMGELERRKYQIQLEAEAAGNEQANQEGLRRGLVLTTTERQAYIDAAIQGSKALQDEAEKEYNLSRQFETGWGNAFRQYVSDATNAAMAAQKIFQTLSQSLEDALYGFFTTGKFGWKQFADDIIKEMIRIETKQLAMNILTGGTGKVGKSGSGLLGLGGLFGFLANGGQANANKPYIVGERGPELFVPNSTGTVVPNGEFGGGGNVTYNINAVDAMSFKQMLAADPTFLHAVAEQGRRRLPGAR
jgi:phage-related minor tail protein